ncbi:MAG: hypothetical protein AABO58_24855 [Acidobacteriota bacterium]
MKSQFVTLSLCIALIASNMIAQTTAPPRVIKPVPIEIVERRCPTVIVYERGVADAFAPGIDPVYPSLALDALLQTGRPVAYDDLSQCDHWFGDSFKLDACVFCCGICSATLEITMRACGSAADCNDVITVGQAPFNVGGYVIWQGWVDPNGCPPGTGPLPVDVPDPALDRVAPPPADRSRIVTLPPTIVKTIHLDPRKLSELICKRKIDTLDVFIQDDRIVDSMRLIITKP